MTSALNKQDDCIVRDEYITALFSCSEKLAIQEHVFRKVGTGLGGRVPIRVWLRELALREIEWGEKETKK